MEISTIAGLASGIGSILAVITAVCFWTFEKRAEKRNELMRVSAWAERVRNNISEKKKSNTDDHSWKIVVMNESKQPIFSWKIFLEWDSKTGLEKEVAESDTEGIIPPGRVEFPWSPQNNPQSESKVLTKIQFLSTNNQIWERSSNGRISKIRQFDVMCED